MAKLRVSPALVPVALIVFALLFTSASLADSYARIVRLSDVDGSVQIDRNTGQGFEKAIMNMPITQGVRVQTGSVGRAEVEFENGSVLRLVGESTVEFTELALRSNGQRVNDIHVDEGLVYVSFRKKGDDDFRISFANRTLDLTRDVHFRLLVDRGNIEIAVTKGELEVQGQSEVAKVKKNETFNLDLTDGAPYTLAKGITTLNTDDYDQERTTYLDQYASNQNYGNSPYTYGYSDMNRYGSFFDAPGYGMVWRPTSFGAGWDPYSDGYWSNYGNQGYVWVSSYPWGWTPYRYGHWVFLPAYGWAWQPGGWNQWNQGVAILNPPPSYHGPVTPPVGSGSTVVVGTPAPRPPRVIQTEDIHNPRRPDRGPTGGPVSSGVVNSGDARVPRDSRTVGTAPFTPGNPGSTTMMPAPPAPIDRQEIGRPDRATKGEQIVQPPANGAVKTVAPTPVTPAPAPPQNMQPSRPTMPQRTETPHVDPPHATQPSAPVREQRSAPPPPATKQASPPPAPKAASFHSHAGGGWHQTSTVSHASGASRPGRSPK